MEQENRPTAQEPGNPLSQAHQNAGPVSDAAPATAPSAASTAWPPPPTGEGNPSSLEPSFPFNPFYLLSIAALTGGLWLAGSMPEPGATSPFLLAGFFLLRNLYDFAIIAAAVYLIGRRINPGDGFFLLVLLPVLLADLAGFQFASGRASFLFGLGGAATSALLAAVKFGLVVRILSLHLHWDRLFLVVGSLGLVGVAPYLFCGTMGGWGQPTLGSATEAMSVVPPLATDNVLYCFWLAAALLAVPLLAQNWKRTTLEDVENHRLLEDTTPLYRAWIGIALLVLPIQLMRGLRPEFLGMSGESFSIHYAVPIVIAMVFTFQAFYRSSLAALIEENGYDFLCLFGLFLVVYASKTPEHWIAPFWANYTLLLTGFTGTLVTRGNLYSGAFLVLVGLDRIIPLVGKAGTQTVAYAREVSRLAWAGLLMGLSFLLLGLGFVFSLRHSAPAKPSA